MSDTHDTYWLPKRGARPPSKATRLALAVPVLSAAALLVIASACGARAGLDGLDGSRGPAPADAGRRDAGLRDAGPPRLDASTPRMDATAPDAGEPDAGPRSDIGDPCGDASECLSADTVLDVPACIGPGVSWPNGGLWDDGYCTAQCTPTSSPGDGEPLARDDCPHDALCVRFAENVGVCLLACEDDGVCRGSGGFPVYQCRITFGAFGDPALPLGVCMPQHCQSRGCPGSARCDC